MPNKLPSNMYDYQLRLVGIVGTGEDNLDAETIVRASALAGLTSPDPLLRFDLVCLPELVGDKKIAATRLAELTHEAGAAFVADANSATDAALQEAGFEHTKPAGLWRKVSQASPEEYGEDYINRWGDTNFLANAEMAAREILAHLPSTFTKDTVRVLDVGCLNSYIMESLYREGVKHVYGTDISYALAITHNLNNYHLPAITIGDFSQNNYANGVSDMTICMEVLEHIPPTLTETFIAELARITSDDGVLLISTSEDPEADPTHINCRKRPEWYYFFSRYGLVPVGKQEIFPGFNSFVLRKAKNPSELKAVHLKNTVNYKGRKLVKREALAPHLNKIVHNLRDQIPPSLQLGRGKASYSQQGEDLIMHHLLHNALGVKNPSYIDIGAHHPYFLSNTAFFYKRGSRGINIEPDPRLFEAFKRLRPGDINLNIGLAGRPGTLDFYVLSATTNSTFVKSEADAYVELGYTIDQTMPIKVDTVASVIQDHCKGVFPDVLSLDVEGMDMEILRSIDFETSKPLVICVETALLAEHTYVKNQEAIDFVLSKGYMVYADTFTNTIFVQEERWQHLF
jgi:FkbM family methyltransferase